MMPIHFFDEVFVIVEDFQEEEDDVVGFRVVEEVVQVVDLVVVPLLLDFSTDFVEVDQVFVDDVVGPFPLEVVDFVDVADVVPEIVVVGIVFTELEDPVGVVLRELEGPVGVVLRELEDPVEDPGDSTHSC
jgi:hypothetical protein